MTMFASVRRMGALLGATALTAAAFAGGKVSFTDEGMMKAMAEPLAKYTKEAPKTDLVEFYKKAPTVADFKKEFEARGAGDAFPAFKVIVAQAKEVLAGQIRYMRAQGAKMNGDNWCYEIGEMNHGITAWKKHESTGIDLPTATSKAIFGSNFTLEEKCVAYAMGRQSHLFVNQVRDIESMWAMPRLLDKRSPENALAIAEARYNNPALFAAGIAVDVFSKSNLRPSYILDHANKMLDVGTFTNGDQAAYNRLIQNDSKPNVIAALFSRAQGVNLVASKAQNPRAPGG